MLKRTDTLVACSLDIRLTTADLARLSVEDTERFCEAITTLATIAARLREAQPHPSSPAGQGHDGQETR